MKEHVPVLLKESIEALNIKPSGIYVDATFGRGGHSEAILRLLNKNGKLYGIDQDPQAVQTGEILEKKYPQFRLIKGNFVNISAFLAINDVDYVDGILFDLGISSPQIDDAKRGFSYKSNGPLDMRMDDVNNSLTAAKVLNEETSEELTWIIRTYGEENYAPLIVKEILNSRPLETTSDLVGVIKRALPAKILRLKGHPAKKTFQALRIYINQELEILQLSLEQSLKLLKPKGRLAIISFHSLEDKIIKSLFNQATNHPYDQIAAKLPLMLPKKVNYRLINKKPIHPTSQEISLNNRAHSAKLWVIERIKGGE